MTKKLYPDNSYLFEFSSKVVDVKKASDGYEVILESTAFYPESGGQLYDTGYLDDNKVVNVYLNDSDDVVHMVDDWRAAVGKEVSGRIDTARRLDNMRKHTGQHILSQSFVATAGAETISAHLGETDSTIELSSATLNPEDLFKAEHLANQIVLENRPVKTFYLTREELGKYPVRKIPEIEGIYRIIEIDGFDCTACGGTHVRQTGEVGLIKIITQEKIRNRLRVGFLTGLACLHDYHAKHEIISSLSNKFTCHFTDLIGSVEKLVEMNNNFKKEIAALNKKLQPLEIERLKKKAVDLGDFKVITEIYDGKDPKELKILAAAVCKAMPAVVVFLFEDKMQIAVSPNLSVSASQIANAVSEKIGGRGGGSPVFAQIGMISQEMKKEIINNICGIIESLLDR